MNTNALSYRCLIFLGWSMLGSWYVIESWVTDLKSSGLIGFVLVQLVLAGMVLRTAGVRVLSIAFCILGFAISWPAFFLLFFNALNKGF